MSTARYAVTAHTAKHNLTDFGGNHDYCNRCFAPIVWLNSRRTGRNYPVNGSPALKLGKHVAGWLYAVNDFHKCAVDDLARAAAIKARNGDN
jgi:hypothetical protein